ncbi:MAG: glycosyltransferase [Propionibacteriaceae bacterium]|jgi:GT2 family glycosyltransferase|nr:glycosyltransferase [Propionibacteriaceae bacterium]
MESEAAKTWSFIDAPELSSVDLSTHDVTAVLVARNGAEWLDGTLEGLRRLEYRPTVIIAVDQSSDDDTASLLRSALSEGLINGLVAGRANATFGQAIDEALSAATRRTRWVWFLHDDATPDPKALSELLTLAARTPRMAIGVPLTVRPARRGQAATTLEVGASISGTGRRHLGIEAGEVAQGQYESRPVLGGSTCGMLVNWNAYEQLGGFDAAIPSYFDGVELGWRANNTNRWVMTCPTAIFSHRQAGRSEVRRGTIAEQAHRTEAAWERLMGLRLVAAHSRGGFVPLTAIKLVLVCLFRTLGFLLGKAPDRARDEIAALGGFLASGAQIRRLRRRLNHDRHDVDARRIRALRPTIGSTIEHGYEAVVDGLRGLFGSQDEGVLLDDLLGDEFTSRAADQPTRVPAWVWALAVLVAVLVGARHLVGTGLVTASHLLGAPTTISEAFSIALASPPGAFGKPDPWLLVLAAASVLAIRPNWFVVAVIALALPAIMLMAAWFLKSFCARKRLRWVAAGGYALLPVLLGGFNRGSLWLLAVAFVLPFAAAWVRRLAGRASGVRALQPIAGIALAGAIAFAVSPSLWGALLLAVVVAAVRSRSVTVAVQGVIGCGLAIGFWAPWLPGIVRQWGTLVVAPDALLAVDQSEAWQILVGRPMAGGLPPLWVSVFAFGSIWLGAVIAVVRSLSRLWPVLVGIVSLAVGTGLTHLVVTLQHGAVVADPSAWVLIGFAALLYATITWQDATSTDVAANDFGLDQALIGLTGLLLILSLIASTVWMMIAGMTGIHRGPRADVPEFLAQNERVRGTATLIIDAGETNTWTLRWHGQTRWDDADHLGGALVSDEALQWAEQAVAHVLAGRQDEQMSAQLEALGVGAVVVIDPPDTAVAALDSAAGMRRVTSSGAALVWTIQGDPTRREILLPDGTTAFLGNSDLIGLDDDPDDGVTWINGEQGILLLAQPPDQRLHVTVGGVELPTTTSPDWRAAYEIGSRQGEVVITRDLDHGWWCWVQGGIVLLLVIFVLPPLSRGNEDVLSPRRGRGEDEAEEDR